MAALRRRTMDNDNDNEFMMTTVDMVVVSRAA